MMSLRSTSPCLIALVFVNETELWTSSFIVYSTRLWGEPKAQWAMSTIANIMKQRNRNMEKERYHILQWWGWKRVSDRNKTIYRCVNLLLIILHWIHWWFWYFSSMKIFNKFLIIWPHKVPFEASMCLKRWWSCYNPQRSQINPREIPL